MALGRILRDFSGWTSAHGIPHIGSAQNMCLRIFWAIIFTGSTIMFIINMVSLVSRFLEYDVTVQTELKFEERYFPAVTVCNLNPYMNRTINESSRAYRLMVEYNHAIKRTKDNKKMIFGLHKLNDTIAIQNGARDQLMIIAADLKENDPQTLDKIVYERSDFVMNCAYNTKPCDKEADFSEKIDPIYGRCFTFNNDTSATTGKPKYKSTRAGPLYGLRLLLKSEQRNYLPLTESAGVRVSVHGQGEEAFPDAFGYNAAAGFTTSFGVKFIRTERLDHPYGNCTKGQPEGRSYFYGTEYSVEGCFRSCFQESIIKACGCADPRYEKPAGTPTCRKNKLDCITKFSSAQSGSASDIAQESASRRAAGSANGTVAQAPTGQLTSAIDDCTCRQPCNESTFGVTVSTALWPSDVYTPPDCDQYGYEDDLDSCREWYGNNTMLVEVYYERMNYQLLSESEAYGLVNLISDTGGQLGLWMGISVITVVEFVSLLILMCLYCMARKEDDEEDPDKPHQNPFDGDNDDQPPDYQEKDDIDPYDNESFHTEQTGDYHTPPPPH